MWLNFRFITIGYSFCVLRCGAACCGWFCEWPTVQEGGLGVGLLSAVLADPPAQRRWEGPPRASHDCPRGSVGVVCLTFSSCSPCTPGHRGPRVLPRRDAVPGWISPLPQDPSSLYHFTF